jgi:hypothetical protein
LIFSLSSTASEFFRKFKYIYNAHFAKTIEAFPGVTLIIRLLNFYKNPSITGSLIEKTQLEFALGNYIRALFFSSYVILFSKAIFNAPPLMALAPIISYKILGMGFIFHASYALISTFIISLFVATKDQRVHWVIAGQIIQANALLILVALFMTYFGFYITAKHGSLESSQTSMWELFFMAFLTLLILYLSVRLIVKPIAKYLQAHFEPKRAWCITLGSLATSWAASSMLIFS